MIRFEPDTWREALLRPLAMAAPNSHVYLEIPAPDLRFVFIALLSVLLLCLARRLAPAPRATLLLLGLVALAFVPWLATSGNGRYFIPFLLAAGPLCLALIYRLPWSRSSRALTALMMMGLQASLVFDNSPWGSWGLVPWRDAPYFPLATTTEMKTVPATYVTITSISYSLIAPLFPAQSHWINVSSMTEDPAASLETRRAHAIFAGSRRIFVVVPTLPQYMSDDKLPTAALMDVIDGRLAPQRLALDRSQSCQLAQSNALASFSFGSARKKQADALALLGLWVCPLRYPVSPKAPPAPDAALDAVFETIERKCPRFFPAGEGATRPTRGGFVRDYPSADMKLYVLDDGGVYYQYWRALNPDLIATVREVMSPSFNFTCDFIRGRSGLPWEREI
jgi:hypothetical protein